MEKVYLKIGKGSFQVNLDMLFCGSDISICVYGGTLPHIGAVAVAVPRDSLNRNGNISASASVICITGHKEDELAKNIALQVSSAMNCNVTVSAGIHIDNATKDDLILLNKNVGELRKNLMNKLKML